MIRVLRKEDFEAQENTSEWPFGCVMGKRTKKGEAILNVRGRDRISFPPLMTGLIKYQISHRGGRGRKRNGRA